MQRAVVLGGGGATGMAWQTSLIAAVLDAGIDLYKADMFIGTSAGSVVAARMASRMSLGPLLVPPRAPVNVSPGVSAPKLSLGTRAQVALAGLTTNDSASARAKLATLSQSGRGISDQERRANFTHRLGGAAWPRTDSLTIPATNLTTGQLRGFRNADGVSLLDAVAASCALPGLWPPVDINGELWMDGGAWSIANAHLSVGYGKVLILAPLLRWIRGTPSVHEQARDLEQAGSEVLVLSPGPRGAWAIKRSLIYAGPAARYAAARAGTAESNHAVQALRSFWP